MLRKATKRIDKTPIKEARNKNKKNAFKQFRKKRNIILKTQMFPIKTTNIVDNFWAKKVLKQSKNKYKKMI